MICRYMNSDAGSAVRGMRSSRVSPKMPIMISARIARARPRGCSPALLPEPPLRDIGSCRPAPAHAVSAIRRLRQSQPAPATGPAVPERERSETGSPNRETKAGNGDIMSGAPKTEVEPCERESGLESQRPKRRRSEHGNRLKTRPDRSERSDSDKKTERIFRSSPEWDFNGTGFRNRAERYFTSSNSTSSGCDEAPPLPAFAPAPADAPDPEPLWAPPWAPP